MRGRETKQNQKKKTKYSEKAKEKKEQRQFVRTGKKVIKVWVRALLSKHFMFGKVK